MKRLLTAFVLLAASAVGHAQLTTIVATKLQISGHPVVTGYVSFTLVDINGIPIVTTDATGAQNGQQDWSCSVVNGTITGAIQNDGTVSGTCKLPDSADTGPANVAWKEQVCDTSVGLATSGKCYTVQTVIGITGATFELDHYAPAATTTNSQPVQYQQGATTPSSCTAPYIFTNTVTAATYVCLAGAYVPYGGATGAAGAAGAVGPLGPAGPMGLVGPAGQVGPAGEKGTTGNTGLTGPQGIQGFTGLTGATGIQGIQGFTGLSGPQGLKGDTGLTGATGLKGDTGAQGVAGPSGSQGPVGPAGTGVGNATAQVAGGVVLANGVNTNTLAKVASTGSYNDLGNVPSFGAAASHGATITVNGIPCILDGGCTIAAGATTFSGLTGVVSLAQLPTIPTTKLSGLGAAATHGATITVEGVNCILDSTCTLPATPFSGITGQIALSQIPQIPSTQISGLGASATHGASVTVNGTTCTLDGTCILPAIPFSSLTGILGTNQLPSSIPGTLITGLGRAAFSGNSTIVNGVPCALDGTCTIPSLEVAGNVVTGGIPNLIAGSNVTITVDSKGNVTINATGSSSGGSGSSALPTVPANAYIYSNLQQEASSCPTYSNSAYNSTANTTNCWGADTANATGLAGAGVVAPTVVKFGVSSPQYDTGGSMMFGVTNPATQTPTISGSSGSTNIVVSSTSGLGVNFKVSGTGIGSGAQIASSWNGSSTTIPLTVANSGTVSGTGTFSFIANALFPNHLAVTLAPVVPSAVTTGTLTVNAGTVKLNNNQTMTVTGATASDTTYGIVAMQLYVDNALYYSDSTGGGASGTSPPAGQVGSPYTPFTYTTGALSAGTHPIAVKAFNSNGDSTLVSFSITIGGAALANISNLLDDFYYYIPSGQALEAFEVDPDIFNYNPNIAGCSGTSCSAHMEASMQCDVASGSNDPGNWRFWNTSSDSWVTQDGTKAGTGGGPQYSCTASQTTNTWHHYQLYATFDVVHETYAYQTLVIDGNVVFQNLHLGYEGNDGMGITGYATNVNFISVQNQIDLTSASSQSQPTVIYYDNYSLSAW